MIKQGLPPAGRNREEILSDLENFGKDDPDYKNGKTWSLVYYLNEDHNNFINEAYRMYSSANGLNPAAFKSLKKLETEIIKITAGLLNGDSGVCGVVTSGGTESCLLAVKTYRDYARKVKGIKKPEMIIPVTAHVAWFKGAEYFGVKPVVIPLDANFQVDTEKAAGKINSRTVMILGSAPEYPHGIIDPIEKLGALGEKHGIPVHVDACVGGFILPFIEKAGKKLPPWDYRVPGVTSVSADIHKYGFAAKGASVITYKSLDIMKHQMFVHQNWPGGVFASPALLGTRPGGAYAAAWAALQSIGEEGYVKLAEEVLKTADALKEGIESIPELEVIGSPEGPLLSYRSVESGVNIFAVGDQMEEKGWHIDRIQMPDALHAMITPLHKKVTDKYIEDLKEAVKTVREHPELAETGSAATYGMIAHVPFRNMVKKQVLDLFAEMYRQEGGEIDLSDSSLAGKAQAGDGGDEEQKKEKKNLMERLIGKYVSFVSKRKP